MPFDEYFRRILPVMLLFLLLVLAEEVFLFTRIVEYEIFPEGIVGTTVPEENAAGHGRTSLLSDLSAC